jgi:hypothetical protein
MSGRNAASAARRTAFRFAALPDSLLASVAHYMSIADILRVERVAATAATDRLLRHAAPGCQLTSAVGGASAAAAKRCTDAVRDWWSTSVFVGDRARERRLRVCAGVCVCVARDVARWRDFWRESGRTPHAYEIDVERQPTAGTSMARIGETPIDSPTVVVRDGDVPTVTWLSESDPRLWLAQLFPLLGAPPAPPAGAYNGSFSFALVSPDTAAGRRHHRRPSCRRTREPRKRRTIACVDAAPVGRPRYDPAAAAVAAAVRAQRARDARRVRDCVEAHRQRKQRPALATNGARSRDRRRREQA